MLEIKSCGDRGGYIYTSPTAEQILNFCSGARDFVVKLISLWLKCSFLSLNSALISSKLDYYHCHNITNYHYLVNKSCTGIKVLG